MEITTPPVDLYWEIQGYSIPADYQYWLYSGLVAIYPPLKVDRDWHWQLGGINGDYGGRSLFLHPGSRLHLRSPSDRVPELVAAMSDRVIRVGTSLIQLGSVEGEPIVPQSTLFSRVVTFAQVEARKRGGEPLPFEFGVTLGKQMKALNVESTPFLGKKVSFHIRGELTKGFSVEFRTLEPKESLSLQTYGIGGRRRIGGGVFKACNPP